MNISGTYLLMGSVESLDPIDSWAAWVSIEPTDSWVAWVSIETMDSWAAWVSIEPMGSWAAWVSLEPMDSRAALLSLGPMDSWAASNLLALWIHGKRGYLQRVLHLAPVFQFGDTDVFLSFIYKLWS